MKHTAYKIETHIILLTLLFKVFGMFNMRLWYDNVNIEENLVDNMGIRCSNCGKTTVLYMKIPITMTW